MILLQKPGSFSLDTESIPHVNILFMMPHSQEHPQKSWLMPTQCPLNLQNFGLNTPFILKWFDLSTLL